jgi:hypothetical protein
MERALARQRRACPRVVALRVVALPVCRPVPVPCFLLPEVTCELCSCVRSWGSIP